MEIKKPIEDTPIGYKKDPRIEKDLENFKKKMDTYATLIAEHFKTGIKKCERLEELKRRTTATRNEINKATTDLMTDLKFCTEWMHKALEIKQKIQDEMAKLSGKLATAYDERYFEKIACEISAKVLELTKKSEIAKSLVPDDNLKGSHSKPTLLPSDTSMPEVRKKGPGF